MYPFPTTPLSFLAKPDVTTTVCKLHERSLVLITFFSALTQKPEAMKLHT